jgi:hypothetical protein
VWPATAPVGTITTDRPNADHVVAPARNARRGRVMTAIIPELKFLLKTTMHQPGGGDDNRHIILDSEESSDIAEGINRLYGNTHWYSEPDFTFEGVLDGKVVNDCDGYGKFKKAGVYIWFSIKPVLKIGDRVFKLKEICI